jgi:hypothetical protein
MTCRDLLISFDLSALTGVKKMKKTIILLSFSLCIYTQEIKWEKKGDLLAITIMPFLPEGQNVYLRVVENNEVIAGVWFWTDNKPLEWECKKPENFFVIELLTRDRKQIIKRIEVK